MPVTSTTRLTATFAALALLGPATTAGAHEVSDKALRQAASSVAKKIQRETRSSSSRATGCKRLFDHRGTCKVVSSYSSGARKCTTTVEITLQGRRARGVVGQTVCS